MPVTDDAIRAADDLIKRLGSKPIRAYHGSPYDFDRFDASKIGTGEGAQSFGHGLYFAGAEDVARGYRDATKWAGVDTANPAMRASLFAHRSGDGSADSAIRAMESAVAKSYFGGSGRDGQLNKAAIEYLRSGGEILPPPLGRMYEVQIAHPETALLDWDAPLGKQPTAVGEMLKNRLSGGYFSMMGEPGDGRRMWHHFVDSYGPPGAAQRLVDAGIPGVRYLDKGSRSAGEGTRNYVMFPGTEDSITILRKYGLLPPLAVAAASQEGDQP